jgi:NTP pyrophosphatase (non-canonical NTP hydrolase)
MNASQYQEWVRARWAAHITHRGDEKQLAIMALGLAGEAGEVIEPIKKLLRGTHPDLDCANLTLELGDVIHYAVAIANHFNINLIDILEANVAKLEARGNKYGDKKGL